MTTADKTTRYYFAYGSNLSDSDREGHDPPCPPGALRKVCNASLPDVRLAFTRHSRGRGGGVLDIVPSKGSLAPGVIYEVTPEGWAWLDKKEGAPSVYRRVRAVALTTDGRAIACVTYEVKEREPFVEPAPGYLELVREAYDAHDLPRDALELAAANRPAEPLSAFFVYGTLMRGELRHRAFSDAAPSCIVLADGWGTLWDCGDYPGLCVDGGDPGRGEPGYVRGELIRVAPERVPGLLERLDAIEEFRGYGERGSLFERRLMEVGVGHGRARLAWVYVLVNESVRRLEIASRDWREHRGVRADFLSGLARAHVGGASELELARDLVRRAARVSSGDIESQARALVPLADALARGDVTERELAQATGLWVVLHLE